MVVAAFEIFLSHIESQLSGHPNSFFREARNSLIYHSFWAAVTIPIVLYALALQRRNLSLPVVVAAHFAGILVTLVLNTAWWMISQSSMLTRASILTTADMSAYGTIWMYSVITGATLGLQHYRSLLAARVRESEYRSSLAQAQLQALKLQLQPHFLFNTLHSISALIRENPDAADDVLADLSALLRMSLDSRSTQEVTVEEELEALDLYLNIQRVRYQEWLTLQLNVSPQARAALMPHLLLQPLVENAIRHGIARRAAPGTLSIDISQRDSSLHLSVRDDGPGCSETGSIRDGIGLSNTKKRLDVLYGQDCHLNIQNTPAGFAIVIELPFRLSPSATAC
jgi:LytS/YehU family sensor histidine kinase